MAADETKNRGIRMTQATSDKLDSLAESSGLSMRELIEQMVSAFQLQAAGSEYSGRIERINQHFSAVSAEIAALMESTKANGAAIAKQAEEYKEQVADLEAKVEALEKENSELSKRLQKSEAKAEKAQTRADKLAELQETALFDKYLNKGKGGKAKATADSDEKKQQEESEKTLF